MDPGDGGAPGWSPMASQQAIPGARAAGEGPGREGLRHRHRYGRDCAPEASPQTATYTAAAMEQAAQAAPAAIPRSARSHAAPGTAALRPFGACGGQDGRCARRISPWLGRRISPWPVLHLIRARCTEYRERRDKDRRAPGRLAPDAAGASSGRKRPPKTEPATELTWG